MKTQQVSCRRRFLVHSRIPDISSDAVVAILVCSITPGLHDLRHTFAVHTLEAWVKRGKDINRMLPVLSGYMGTS
jgi:hypothetical protein